MEEEIWKDVEGFPGYKVSNFGNVIGLHKRVMKPQLNTKGYYVIGLYKDNKLHIKKVYRLLAIAFIPNPENKLTVDHIDRNPLNNALSNLRWATRTEQSLNRNMPLGILQEKYIYKHGNGFRVKIQRNCKIIYNKTFKTFPESVLARDTFLQMQ